MFLDRDGTVVVHVDYARSAAEIELLPGAGEAIREFRRRGYLVVLITNQSGIGRGYFTQSDLESMHDKLCHDLAEHEAKLDAIYHCPHLPADLMPPGQTPCDCRKPNPGMLRRAAEELGIDLAQSFMIGDAASDIESGKAAGCRTGLLAPNARPDLGPVEDFGADFTVHTLLDVLPHLDPAT